MASDIVSQHKRLLLLPNNDLWKRQRKIMHEILGPSKRKVFEPWQELETRVLLYEYLTRPDKWHKAHARFANSVIMNVVFGRRTRIDDPALFEINRVSEEFVQLLDPAGSLVDALPFLARTPIPRVLQPWRWWGDRLYQETLR